MIDATQVSILLGLTAAQVIAVALPYWVGRQLGQRAGLTAAGKQLIGELESARSEQDKTQRELCELSSNLAFLREQQAQKLRHHLDEIVSLKRELNASRALSAQHAQLLRDAAKTIRLACAGWDAMGATLKARECRPLAAELSLLADSITGKEAIHA